MVYVKHDIYCTSMVKLSFHITRTLVYSLIHCLPGIVHIITIYIDRDGRTRAGGILTEVWRRNRV